MDIAIETTDVIAAITRAFEHQKTCNWQCPKCLSLLENFEREL